MDKHTQHNRSIRTVALLLGIVMAIPLVTQLFMSEPSVKTAELVSLFNADIEAIRQQALEDRDRVRAQRRAYTRAMERCRDRLAKGEKVVCPNINDASTFKLQNTHEAAPVEVQKDTVKRSANHYSVQQLSTQERRILRSYTRANFCSKAAGVLLYNLCMDIVGDSNNQAPRGLENDNVQLHKRNTAGPATLKLRLQMIDEAISGTKRKTIRPTGY